MWLARQIRLAPRAAAPYSRRAQRERRRELEKVRRDQDRIIAEMDEILNQLARFKGSQGMVEVVQMA
jgi:hypothetical protein